MFWVFLYPVFATDMTIVGEVNYFYQIMADGQIYEVANTSMGDDLVINHIAEKVEVTGTVEEKEEMKIITVKSFKVVLETNQYAREVHYGDEKKACISYGVCGDTAPRAFWNDSLMDNQNGEISPQELEALFKNYSEFQSAE
jgi:hypothetical protein